MNPASSTSSVFAPRPGADPVFGRFGGLFRTTLRSLRMQWFLYRAQHRKAGAKEPVGEMNAHMLRDIGAPEEMIASATAVKPAYWRHGIPFGLSVVMVSLALTGTPTPASAETVAQSGARNKAPARVDVASAPLAAVFAGEYVNGAPVYRFPTVVVT